MIPDQISVKRACGALGIGKTKLYDLMNSGRLRSVKIGRRRLVDSDSLADFISRCSMT